MVYCAKLGVIRLPLILLGRFATHWAPDDSLQVGGTLYNQLANAP